MQMIERISRQLCVQYKLDPDKPQPHKQGEPVGLGWQIVSPVVVDVMSAAAKAFLASLGES